jgi:hypothetical protein
MNIATVIHENSAWLRVIILDKSSNNL